MSVKEQEKIQEKYYSEAIRYMDNAKESLKKAYKEGFDDAYTIINKIRPQDYKE